MSDTELNLKLARMIYGESAVVQNERGVWIPERRALSRFDAIHNGADFDAALMWAFDQGWLELRLWTDGKLFKCSSLRDKLAHWTVYQAPASAGPEMRRRAVVTAIVEAGDA